MLLVIMGQMYFYYSSEKKKIHPGPEQSQNCSHLKKKCTDTYTKKYIYIYMYYAPFVPY